MTVPFLAAESFRRADVVHGFSLRAGGVSAPPFDSLNLGGKVGDEPDAVEENLRRFLAAVGIDRNRLAAVNQVHGANVVVASLSGAVMDADAIIIPPGMAGGIRTADCLAILLHDPRTGYSAAVHAGWRGTVERVVVRAVEAMERAGARPAELMAAIGPGIGRCCFRVGPEVSSRFADDGDFGPSTVDHANGRRDRVDLVLANRKLLEAKGVRQVEVIPGCTSCSPELFYSHRRDAGRTGRHLAVIASRE